MPRRVPIPRELRRRAFTSREGIEAGLGEHRLRGVDLGAPFHGVRLGADVDDSLLARGRAYALRMRADAALSHITALRLFGTPLPRDWTPEESLHVSVPRPVVAPKGRGVIGHQITGPWARRIVRLGLPVTDPATSFCLAATLLDHDDLVAVGDHLVFDPYELDPHDPRPYSTLPELSERAAAMRGAGARAARSAVLDVRVGAESRMETKLRLVLARAGLPEPLLNDEVYDARGRFVGRPDLKYLEYRVTVEYDGEPHRDAARWDRDASRRDRFIDCGWHPVHIRRQHLRGTGQHAVDLVARALSRRGWRV